MHEYEIYDYNRNGANDVFRHNWCYILIFIVIIIIICLNFYSMQITLNQYFKAVSVAVWYRPIIIWYQYYIISHKACQSNPFPWCIWEQIENVFKKFNCVRYQNNHPYDHKICSSTYFFSHRKLWLFFLPLPLTHWGQDKMPTIPQTFSNAFYWINTLDFQVKLNWNMFL